LAVPNTLGTSFALEERGSKP